VTLQEQIRSNRLRSTIVVFGFVVLLLFLAGIVGFALDVSFGIFALVLAAAYGIFGLVRSRSMVARLTHAEELAPEAAQPLRRLVENVSIAAGLPVTPEVRIVQDSAPTPTPPGSGRRRATSASPPGSSRRCHSVSSKPCSRTRCLTSGTATRT
jgi:Zn-dependent protease with chaperone function